MKSESVEQVFLIYILPICFKSFLQVVLQTFYVLWIQKFELNMTRIKKKKKKTYRHFHESFWSWYNILKEYVTEMLTYKDIFNMPVLTKLLIL